jgi:hypothetical protein
LTFERRVRIGKFGREEIVGEIHFAVVHGHGSSRLVELDRKTKRIRLKNANAKVKVRWERFREREREGRV